MDPLSVSAGIAGLLIATSQVSSILIDFCRSATEAPKQARTILSEVTDISAALQHLQSFLVGTTTVGKSRASLILVEQLIVALTGCVTTVSDLQSIIAGFTINGSMGLLDRAKWARKEASVGELVQRLQNHKTSLTLMLTILDCKSTAQVERSMDRLCNLVEEVLVSNSEIHNRLRTTKSLSEGRCSVEIHMRCPRTSVDSRTSLRDRQHETQSVTSPFQPTFEEELDTSRVYKRAHYNNSQSSLVSLTDKPTASVVLSRFSLGEISVTAVLDLPLYATDIFNSQIYEFGANSQYDMKYKDEDKTGTESEPSRSQTARTSQSSMLPDEPVQPSLRSLSQIPLLSKSARKSARGVFGVPLHKSIKYASLAISLTDKRGSLNIKGHIPIVVGRLCSYLNSKDAFNVPSLFSRREDTLGMDILQRAFEESPSYGKGLDLTGYSLSDAAGVLLRYLNGLPQPLIPTASYEQACQNSSYFVETWNANNDSAAASVASSRILTKKISLAPYHLLLYILEFLAGLESNSRNNGMDAITLSNIFQPCIIRGVTKTKEITGKRSAQKVVTSLIKNQENFNDAGIVHIALGVV